MAEGGRARRLVDSVREVLARLAEVLGGPAPQPLPVPVPVETPEARRRAALEALRRGC